MKTKSNQATPKSRTPARPAKDTPVKESGIDKKTTGSQTPGKGRFWPLVPDSDPIFTSGLKIGGMRLTGLSGAVKTSTPSKSLPGKALVMIACTEQQFDALRKKYRQEEINRGSDYKGPRFSGPYIHSTPKGDMFRGPFSEWAWVLGTETVLLKTQGGPADGWKYFRK